MRHSSTTCEPKRVCFERIIGEDVNQDDTWSTAEKHDVANFLPSLSIRIQKEKPVFSVISRKMGSQHQITADSPLSYSHCVLRLCTFSPDYQALCNVVEFISCYTGWP